MSLGRIEEAAIQPGLVAEQEQALRVRIEAAKRVDLLGQAKVRQGPPTGTGLGGELREHPIGLEEGNEHGTNNASKV